jgi:tRNA A37 threonylcarbamoyladenosine dehydratase
MSDVKAPLRGALRRALTRQSAATTVTVTRVTGRPDTDEPDTVVTIAEPVRDTASHRLARAAMVTATVALALAVSAVAWRMWRNH